MQSRKESDVSNTKSEKAGSEPISVTKVEMLVAWNKRVAIERGWWMNLKVIYELKSKASGWLDMGVKEMWYARRLKFLVCVPG